MAPHSSTLAWEIPWTEEPRRLRSMGSLRVRHNWATSLSLFTFIHWRRKWQLTAVFLPGESQGRGEPGGLPSMGSHRVRHDWSDLAAAAADVGNLISHSSAFSKNSLNIWKFTVHILLKPGLETFELYFTSVWDECNCVVVWAFFGIAFLWDWNENWPFPVTINLMGSHFMQFSQTVVQTGIH